MIVDISAYPDRSPSSVLDLSTKKIGLLVSLVIPSLRNSPPAHIQFLLDFLYFLENQGEKDDQ
jgi:hypothetical protein